MEIQCQTQTPLEYQIGFGKAGQEEGRNDLAGIYLTLGQRVTKDDNEQPPVSSPSRSYYKNIAHVPPKTGTTTRGPMSSEARWSFSKQPPELWVLLTRDLTEP